jgi:hypothetical protein
VERSINSRHTLLKVLLSIQSSGTSHQRRIVTSEDTRVVDCIITQNTTIRALIVIPGSSRRETYQFTPVKVKWNRV